MVSGGTLHAFANILYGKIGYEEMLEKFSSGEKGNVDILVRDIYGEDSGFQIDGDIVAGSLGKLPKLFKEGKTLDE